MTKQFEVAAVVFKAAIQLEIDRREIDQRALALSQTMSDLMFTFAQ